MSGAQLKEAGQQMALFGAGDDWLSTTLDKLAVFCADLKRAGRDKFRFEEFRAAAPALGVKQPSSHKAWGAVPRVAVKRKIIGPTNEYQAAQSEKTHAHPVKVWEAL